MSDNTRHTLPGSARPEAFEAADHAPLDPDQPVEVTLVLRRREDGGLGAVPGDLEAVTAALEAAHVEIVSSDAESRRIRARGSVGTLSQLFGTQLQQVTSTAPDGRRVSHRQRTGELSVPDEMHGRVIAVLGLDDRPQARTRFRLASAAPSAGTFTPLQLGTLYDFPPATDGSGQAVAIIELGGGFDPDELDTYFRGLGVQSPTVTAVGVDGGSNQPDHDPQGPDGEVLLDIEVVGALAPAAAIGVYFAPNTDDGFLDAVSEAVHAAPTPAAISISWGQSEDAWTEQARTAMDGVFADALTLGIVVTVASGDNGSTDGAGDGKDHVDFPASSPNVLACGGTRLTAAGSSISAETVWNSGGTGGATGGGVSTAFARPARQASVGVPGSSGRGVPDVAGDADPQTGYQVLVDGSSTVIGGTSAVAPLWAALVARLAQSRGGLLKGFADALYAGVAAGRAAPGFRDVTSGDNGTFQAGPGWDACTGLGSPDGSALLTKLASAAD